MGAAGGLLGFPGAHGGGGFAGLPPGLGALLPPPPKPGGVVVPGGAAAVAAPKVAKAKGGKGKAGMGGMGKPPPKPKGGAAGAVLPVMANPAMPIGMGPPGLGVGALGLGGWGPPPGGPPPVGAAAAFGGMQMPIAGLAVPPWAAGGAVGGHAGLGAVAAAAAPAAAGPGPWVHLPLAPHAFGQLGFGAGTRLEVVTYDSVAQPCGSMTVVITGVWPADASGQFLEVSVEGCSPAVFLPVMQGVFSTGSVLHLCTTGVAACCQAVGWPGRNVVHTDTVRMLPPATGAVAQAVGGAAPAAQPGAAAASSTGPGAAVAKGAGAGGDGAAEVSPTEAELKKKLERLREKLRKRSLGETLAERAEAALEGRRVRRRKGDRGRDKDSSEDSLFDEAPSAGSSRRVQRLARSDPGALMASGLAQIREYLAQRGGASSDELDEASANVVQYITSVWHGMHPQSEMGVRNVREMRMVGECLDALTRGELPKVGDMLMQRLKAIEH